MDANNSNPLNWRNSVMSFDNLSVINSNRRLLAFICV
jgi:hypothetical protein